MYMHGKLEHWSGNKKKKREEKKEKEKKMEVRFFERSSLRIRRSGRMVVRSPNPVHSVLYRVVVFVNASRRRLRLQVEFRARILRVVYVGAIAILFRFVVMMLNLSETMRREDRRERSGVERGQIFGGMTRRMARVRGRRYVKTRDPLIPSEVGEREKKEVRSGRRRTRTGTYLEWVKRRDPMWGITGFGQVRYTDGRLYVVSGGMVLLVAIVGAIVLTLKHRSFAMAKRQQIDQQRSRDGDRGRMRVKNR